MTEAEGNAWWEALERYGYPVDLSRFIGRADFGPEWFPSGVVDIGDREQTIAFENRFRHKGEQHLEAWYEVVFWKMFSQGRRNHTTSKVVQRVTALGIQPSDLWQACAGFVATGNRKSFENLQSKLIASKAIPVAATFPAFICPERFPMVDSQIARWVVRYLKARPDEAMGNTLVAPSASFIDKRNTTLTVRDDWDFYHGWIEWCRRAAGVLKDVSSFGWRARDVEMAAFQNERSHSPLLPPIPTR